MSYQVLARKWRPKHFGDVVGQEHVLQALINALNQNRLHHAYLFTGTRGVGKTTIARILAKCLNCDEGISAKPCGKCSTCLSIDAGRYPDLIEVDAASRTKVEDTRALLDNVDYAPTQGRFKVYLIDEVHMLSSHSFNALLKTLEEPPEHVKFLLATTDPQKLPITVVSRCLQFQLRHVATQTIVEHLKQILGNEAIEYEETALHELAQAAQGSVRDGLSLADQAIAYGDRTIKLDDVRAMLGTVDRQYVMKILVAIASGDPKKLVLTIREIAEFTTDFHYILSELMQGLHQLTIIQLTDETLLMDLSMKDQLQNLAKKISPEDVQLMYQIALLGQRDLPLMPDTSLGFEMILLRMLLFVPAYAQSITQTKPVSNQASSVVEKRPATLVVEKKLTSPVKVEQKVEQETPSPADTGVVKNALDHRRWFELCKQLNLTGLVRQLAGNCELAGWSDTEIKLQLEKEQAMMLTDQHRQKITEKVSDVLAKKVNVIINIIETVGQTPAKFYAKQKQHQQQQAVNQLKQDDQVNQLLQTFDAEVIPDSITHIQSSKNEVKS